ncbi:response regulator [Ramlibacter pallidus]|uniref:Response regulator n=1 Tax=Ramlibacter pallidus TaxID=2780087 RepID=A0ABR9RZ39_9BURK|nr:response regulator [Ramlibacter pallidus]MBE7366519.1 response regulator [Ramlibacter pallidus]
MEDRHDMQVLLRERLAAAGGSAIVATAITEAEAKSWLAEHPDDWDVAIIDLVLDQGSGFGVIPRAASAAKKVVVFSSYVTDGIRWHCERLGADAVFDKSDSEALVRWVAEQGA